MAKDTSIHHPHDNLFQAALTHKNVAIDFLKHRLPAFIKKRVDFSTLNLERTTFISKRLRKRYSDVVYSAKIGGKKGYIYTLIEHQSNEDDHQVLRLLEYMGKLIAQHVKKHPKSKFEPYPVIVPLVCYTGREKSYKGPKSIASAFVDPDLFIQSLRHTFLRNVNEEKDEETMKDGSAALVSLLLKHAKWRDLCTFLEDKKLVKLIKVSSYKEEALLYIVAEDKHQPEYVIEKIGILGPDTKYKVMNHLQRTAQQGKAEGRAEGRAEGAKSREMEIARSMLKEGLRLRTIEKTTGLSVAEIRNLLPNK